MIFFTEISYEIESETSLIASINRPLISVVELVRSINYKAVIIASRVDARARTNSVSFRDLTRFRDLRSVYPVK